MKRALQIVAFVLFAIALAGLMGFIYIERENQILADINVRICRETDRGFLNKTELLETAEAIDSIGTTKIKRIDTNKLEEIISSNPYVENVDVFVNIDNQLMINVREKSVVLRIFNQNNKGYYIDKNAGILPLSNQFSSRVLVANGYIDVPYLKGFNSIFDSVYNTTSASDSALLVALFTLTKIISQSNFLQAQISQIYVNSKGEFDLIPQLGNQLIHFGSMEDAEEKLDKLELFYKKALVKEGWEKYKTINLKYKNQVVCTKK
jgi:cell division protein FtsQ